MDGKFWDDPYTSLDFGNVALTEQARYSVQARYDSYLSDVVWLANQSPADIDRASRDTIIRATCSVRLLKSDVVDR